MPFRVTSWHADGHGTFGVRWAPVPASLAAGRTPEQVLDALVAMQLDPMKPEQLQTADVAWPGGLARDVSGVMGSMRQRGVWPFRGRVLLVGDRVVIAIAYDQQAEFDAEAADTFVRGVTPGG